MSPNSLIFLLKAGLQTASLLQKSLKKSDPEKRRQAMVEFDEAMKKAKKGEETRDLEKWFLKNL